jgi:hypothetical protein
MWEGHHVGGEEHHLGLLAVDHAKLELVVEVVEEAVVE